MMASLRRIVRAIKKLRVPLLTVALVSDCDLAASAADTPHWSFLPVRKPAIPKVKNAVWLRDGKGVFILAKLEAAGIAPNPDADRSYLFSRRGKREWHLSLSPGKCRHPSVGSYNCA
jgi:hypothetical protein